ncbi:ABC transporter permease [Psychroflexus sp. ALD_RP9]|uniref:ABC transporter permease n=1 Tax=Psychroflexus sp. ALD_RP9 TaxID=2777186 RepID=UPI001A90C149|nr:ABC transporter permease [Psychroflexus sp. ALD_RP9]QSS96132.1 ABC transporter permease [Psychroflexus sp. ALD_RP9]
MWLNKHSQTYLALQKFKSNFWGVSSFVYVVLISIVALLAYIIAPDNSANANQMALSIHSKPPGFTVKGFYKKAVVNENSTWFLTGKSASAEFVPIETYKLKNDSLFYNTYGILENEFDQVIPLSELSSKNNSVIHKQTYWLGTDKYGRDLLSRLLIGSRISLSIGFVAVFISLLIGISLGAIAGYFGGKIDQAIMWLINVTWSIPTLLLVIAITLVLGKGFWQVFIAVGLTMWVEVARVVRGQFISLKNEQYIVAAKTLGLGHRSIMFKHILPNAIAPVIVISAANFAAAILIESGLSFLGIGAQPPIPSWGAMIKDHYSYIIVGKAYLAIIPGLAIMSLVMAFMLIGNALRDALDVKS